MITPSVSLRSVAVRKPGALILRSVDLDLAPGSSTALFGHNGSGKTTLMRLVATLLPPSSGSGTVLGAKLGSREVERVRPRIGLVGHEPALLPNLTLGENIALARALIDTGTDSPTPQQALAIVGLKEAGDRRASRSSNGMRRRAEFARMLILRPDLLLLDEAHVGLDPKAWLLVEHLITEVTDRGGCALVVAHEADRIRPLVNASVTISDGSVERGAE